jgi:hypothetical protein
VREEIKDLLGKLQREDHSNIWIILTHLSKDPFLIDSITEHAKKLFSEIVPSEFGKDVEFLKGFYGWIPKIVLEDKTPQEMREVRRKQMEERHAQEQKLSENESGGGDETITLITKLNAAFRTIEVLGQIVRNFPGRSSEKPSSSSLRNATSWPAGNGDVRESLAGSRGRSRHPSGRPHPG